eukprot:6187571-Pleurochrysis_carterae.AAC.1
MQMRSTTVANAALLTGSDDASAPRQRICRPSRDQARWALHRHASSVHAASLCAPSVHARKTPRIAVSAI